MRPDDVNKVVALSAASSLLEFVWGDPSGAQGRLASHCGVLAIGT